MITDFQIQIIYASISGNVEFVVEQIALLLNRSGFQVELVRAERYLPRDLVNNKNLIFATSTWEHGELNPQFIHFLEQTLSFDYSQHKAGFVGLGDSRYEPVFFCTGIDILQNNFTKNSGKVLGETLKINGEPSSQIEKMVVPWVEKFINEFKK